MNDPRLLAELSDADLEKVRLARSERVVVAASKLSVAQQELRQVEEEGSRRSRALKATFFAREKDKQAPPNPLQKRMQSGDI